MFRLLWERGRPFRAYRELRGSLVRLGVLAERGGKGLGFPPRRFARTRRQSGEGGVRGITRAGVASQRPRAFRESPGYGFFRSFMQECRDESGGLLTRGRAGFRSGFFLASLPGSGNRVRFCLVSRGRAYRALLPGPTCNHPVSGTAMRHRDIFRLERQTLQIGSGSRGMPGFFGASWDHDVLPRRLSAFRPLQRGLIRRGSERSDR
jgi:hypothetical protein